MDRDSDGDIKIKFDDDGTTSDYVKTRNVSVLISACVDWSEAERLIRAAPELASETDQRGLTALYHAVRANAPLALQVALALAHPAALSSTLLTALQEEVPADVCDFLQPSTRALLDAAQRGEWEKLEAAQSEGFEQVTNGHLTSEMRGYRAPAAWPPLVAAALHAPEAVVERLRSVHVFYEEMALQTPGMLEAVASILGATAEQVDHVCKADDTRSAAIEQVMLLRSGLEAMRLGSLRKRLKSLGASTAQLDDLDDAEEPGPAAAELAVTLAVAQARKQAHEDEKAATILQLQAKVETLSKDAERKDAIIARLETTIQEMREENERLQATRDEVLEDNDDPFAALDSLLGGMDSD